MKNKTRKQKRYQKRQKIRKAHKEKFLSIIPSYEQVFTFENLWNAFWLCRQQVSWKPSIQIFQQNLSWELTNLLKILHSKEGFHSDGFIEFDICERGKMRHIKSVNIRERVVQRCFCDNYLIPLLTKNLIYDNGASLKDKGITFSLNRLIYHLKKYYKKHQNNEGWIVLYDFSNYFGNINHNKLYAIVDPLMLDNKCLKLYHHLIDVFGEVGLGLGSQVSQISAIIFPNQIDQILTHHPRIQSYGRYMDDGYFITQKKEYAQECIKILFQESKKLNINLNPKKVRIMKIKYSFIYLKKRFFLTDQGNVILRLNKNNIYKHRRRIKKLLKMTNVLNLSDIQLSHKSWFGQVRKKFKNHKSIYNIDCQIKEAILSHEHK